MASDQFALPDGTHTVAMGVGDLNGILRGKRVPAKQWPRVSESGIALSIATFAVDMTSDVWDTPYVSMDNGYPDMHIVPAGPVRAVPWEEGCAFCFGRAVGMDHQRVPIDPRGTLEAQVARAEAMGFEVSVGAELEFYLLDPETGRPVDVGNQVYGLGRAAELEHVIGPIRRQLPGVGIPVEQSNPEYAPGQVEVNIRYGPVLEAADRVVAFRCLRQGDRGAARLSRDVHVQALRRGVGERLPHPLLTLAGRDEHVRGRGRTPLRDRARLSRRPSGTDGGDRARGRDHPECLSPAPALYLLPHQQPLGGRQPHRGPSRDRGRAGRDPGREAGRVGGLQPLLPHGLRRRGGARRHRAGPRAASPHGRQRLRVPGGGSDTCRSRDRP